MTYFNNSNNSTDMMEAKLPAISKSTTECTILESFNLAMWLWKGSLRDSQNSGLEENEEIFIYLRLV